MNHFPPLLAACKRHGLYVGLVLLTPLMLVAGLTVPASADILTYDLSKHPLYPQPLVLAGRPAAGNEEDVLFVLPGRIAVMDGVHYTHPSGRQAIFKSGDDRIRILRAPTSRDVFRRYLGSAGNDPEAIPKAAAWAVKKRLLPDAYKAVDRVLEIDPQHDVARRVASLRQVLKEPLPENPQTVETLRLIVRKPDMRIVFSNHFALLTDTDTAPRPGSAKPSAYEWLDLLENFYERFFLLFELQDVQLERPKDRVMVVLLNDEADFREYATAFDATFRSSSGFWDPVTNVAFFCDVIDSSRFKLLGQMIDKSPERDAGVPGGPKPTSDRNIFKLLLHVERENQMSAVASRIACHQLAANCGLLARQVAVPNWAREGLASYFETPSDGAWEGIGAVNRERLDHYRSLTQNEPLHATVEFLVSKDFVLDSQSSSRRHAVAWAWTHFLIEAHHKEFVVFCRMMSDMPPHVTMPGEVVAKLCSQVFGPDRRVIDQEWRAYMRALKTDVEKIEEISAENQ